MTHRYDRRTKEQFARDIYEATKIEKGLMDYYVAWLNSMVTDNNPYFYQDHGIDNSGRLIENGKVSTDADFLLKRKGKRNRKIEIKFSRKNVSKFRLKVEQVLDYIQEDVCIIVFKNLKDPEFCIIPPADLSEHLKHAPREEFFPWGGKEVIVLNSSEVEWHKLS